MRIQSSLLPNRLMSPWVIGFTFTSGTWMDSVRRPEARYGTCTWVGVRLPHDRCYRVKKRPTGISVKFSVFQQDPSSQGEVSSQVASGLSEPRASVSAKPNWGAPVSSGHSVAYDYHVSNCTSSEFNCLPSPSSAFGVSLLQQAFSLIFNFLSNPRGQILSTQYFFLKNPPELCLPLLTPECFDWPDLGPVPIPGVVGMSASRKLCGLRGAGKVIPKGKSECFYKEENGHWEGRDEVVHYRLHNLIPWILLKGYPTTLPAHHHLSPSKIFRDYGIESGGQGWIQFNTCCLTKARLLYPEGQS